MNEKAIWLAVAVLAVYAFVIIGTVSVCAVYAEDIVAGRFKCDAEGRVQKMLEQMMTFVGAFLAGKYSGASK